jgi:hypothetical protein
MRDLVFHKQLTIDYISEAHECLRFARLVLTNKNFDTYICIACGNILKIPANLADYFDAKKDESKK